jgi:hypothetical protein
MAPCLATGAVALQSIGEIRRDRRITPSFQLPKILKISMYISITDTLTGTYDFSQRRGIQPAMLGRSPLPFNNERPAGFRAPTSCIL